MSSYYRDPRTPTGDEATVDAITGRLFPKRTGEVVDRSGMLAPPPPPPAPSDEDAAFAHLMRTHFGVHPVP